MVTFPFSARSIKNFPVIYYNNIEEPWRQTHWHLGFPCDLVPLPSFTLEFVYIKPSAVFQWPTVRALPGTGSHRGFYPVELWGSDTKLQIEGATVDLVASLLTARLTFLFLQLPVSQTIIVDSEEKYSQAEAWKEGLSSCQGELSYPQGPRISGQYSEQGGGGWMSQLRDDTAPSAPTLLSSAQSLDLTEVETQPLGQLMGWSEANWCSHMEFGVNKRCFKIIFLCIFQTAIKKQ